MKFTSRYTLKDLRELNRLTLKQVARKVKLNKERIAELEQDSSFITIDEMFRFSKILWSFNKIYFYRRTS
ncbi:helix-turn-helix transcriptional regulator [Lactococcus lactis]|uniref:helix-turn-helix domain-containing protein n=1 Tax=Lactococcus lactis TaxID=1358 RepID=UPI00223B2F30|nr:helix-turn-helix transcriptional regulator [Lactococcus lactis]